MTTVFWDAHDILFIKYLTKARQSKPVVTWCNSYFEFLSYLLYSPDLVPSNFYLIADLREIPTKNSDCWNRGKVQLFCKKGNEMLLYEGKRQILWKSCCFLVFFWQTFQRMCYWNFSKIFCFKKKISFNFSGLHQIAMIFGVFYTLCICMNVMYYKKFQGKRVLISLRFTSF